MALNSGIRLSGNSPIPVVEVTANNASGRTLEILQRGTGSVPGFKACRLEQGLGVTGDFFGGAIHRTGNNGDFHRVRIPKLSENVGY